MPFLRRRKKSWSSRKISQCSKWIWSFPFIGLFILVIVMILNKRNLNNPDGSCTNPVIRMFDTEYQYQRKIRDGSPIAQLYYIPTYDDHGFCLDGTQPAFYYRPGTESTKYQIYFEGGGFCFDYKKCSKRSENRLGSSQSYKKFAWFSDEYLSTKKGINKLSYNWNTIFVRYCDGMTYLANKKSMDVWQKKPLYFQGYKILQNLMRYLFIEDNQFDLNQATDIIIAGSSSGGMAVLYHVNYIWSNFIKPIKQKNENFKFMALIECGYFRVVHQNTARHLLWLYENMNIDQSLNKQCIEYYSQTDVCFAGDKDCVDDGEKKKDDSRQELYYCLFLEYLIKFISPEIKIFLMQSRFDFNYHSKDEKELVKTYNKMGDEYTEYIMDEFLKINEKENPNRMNRGAFISSCKHHCGQFNNIEIDQYVVNEAIYEFYNSEELGTNRNVWFQKATYPCNDCCFIPEFSKYHDPAPVYGCELSE